MDDVDIVIGVDDVNEGELLNNNLLNKELGRASSEMLMLIKKII